MAVAQNRSDDVSKAVTARINFEYDLIAAEAKYHDNCYKSFLRPNIGGRPFSRWGSKLCDEGNL